MQSRVASVGISAHNECIILASIRKERGGASFVLHLVQKRKIVAFSAFCTCSYWLVESREHGHRRRFNET